MVSILAEIGQSEFETKPCLADHKTQRSVQKLRLPYMKRETLYMRCAAIGMNGMTTGHDRRAIWQDRSAIGMNR